MAFDSPIWLALLLPWAALTLWLLLWRRARMHVPFLALWRGEVPEPPPAAQRQFNLPPLYLLAALATMLLAILASARPVLTRAGATDDTPMTLILDRGVTMTGNKFDETVARAVSVLRARFGPGPLTLVDAASGDTTETVRANLSAARSMETPELRDTRQSVRQAVRRALARQSRGPIVVLSDHMLADDPRVVQFAPAKPLSNVGIARIAAREQPRPQVMVTLRNDSSLSDAIILVRSGNEEKRLAVELPPRGTEKNYFLDLDHLSRTIDAELRVDGDELPIDNVAYLVRRRAWPKVEVRGDVPAEVRRVAEAYSRARPAGEGSATVAVSDTPMDGPSVVVTRGAVSDTADAKLVVADHAVTASVNWADAHLRPVDVPADAGWTNLVTAGAKALVAARESPARQVRVSIDSSDFARTPAFVIFWTNLLDWVGSGNVAAGATAETFSAGSAILPDRSWVPTTGRFGDPGIYARGDGTLAAVNVDPVIIDPPVASNAHAKLDALKPREHGGLQLAPWLALAALACLLAAAALWPRGRRNSALTAFSAPRTV